MKTKVTKLNNKSRKGWYVYIREEGKPGRYYKLNTPSEDKNKYVKYYKKRYVKKQKVDFRKMKKKYSTKKRKKGKSMKKSLKKAIGRVRVKDVHRITNKEVNEKNRKLLSKSVNDEQIMKIMIQEENLQKMKMRFNHQLKIYNDLGKVMATDVIIGQNTLREIIAKIRSAIMKGEVIEGSLGWVKINQKLGTKIKNGDDGVIGRVELNSNFTVGKR